MCVCASPSVEEGSVLRDAALQGQAILALSCVADRNRGDIGTGEWMFVSYFVCHEVCSLRMFSLAPNTATRLCAAFTLTGCCVFVLIMLLSCSKHTQRKSW